MKTRDEIFALDPDALNKAIWEAHGWVEVGSFQWRKDIVLHSEYAMPDYARDILAAWELVAGWNYIGSEWLMNLSYFGEAEELLYQCVIRHIGYGTVANADTAPLAISRAWLIWKQERS